MYKEKFRVCLIGPVPPPYGGMSVQTTKLDYFLRKEGLDIHLVPVNLSFPRGFRFIDKLKYIRAFFRLFFYLAALVRELKRVNLIHILSNSYLSFFLYTAPAVFIAKLYRNKVIINYRGGGAREFMKKYRWAACRILNNADAITVPSEFLLEVFTDFGYTPYVVPNIIDLEQFVAQKTRRILNDTINILVVRNLEKIYNVACAVRAFKQIKKDYPLARLILVGEGSEEQALKRLVIKMGLEGVVFKGRMENHDIPEMYGQAAVVLNPADVDNFPISVLESFASAVPIVSTNAGGIPFMIKDNITGLLVNRDDDKQMARCVVRLLKDEKLYKQLTENGQKEAVKYSWKSIKPVLFKVYKQVVGDDYKDLL